MLRRLSLHLILWIQLMSNLSSFQIQHKIFNSLQRLHLSDHSESNIQDTQQQRQDELVAAPRLLNMNEMIADTQQQRHDDPVVVPRLSNMNEMIADEGARGIDFSGLSKDPEYYFQFRESEIKHGRIAMLAAVGWPFSELYHYTLSKSMGLEDMLLETNGKAPSVLNGGLDNTYVLLALGTFFAVGAVLELEEMKRRNPNDPAELQNFMEMWREDGWDAPGNYGFDPLRLGKLFCPTTRSKVFMQGIEINNGRLAMLATVGFVVQEFITGNVMYLLCCSKLTSCARAGLPVVAETPQFFGR